MNFQKNDFGEYTLQSDIFKDFWFLKCHLVDKICENCFLLKREYLRLLPTIDSPLEPPIGWYGKLQNLNVKDDYTTLRLKIEFNEDGLCFISDISININTGIVVLNFYFSHINKKSYKDPPEFEEYTKEWMRKELASVDYDRVNIQRDIVFDIIDIVEKRYLKNFEDWLKFLSELPKEPDPTKPPCSEECPHKFLLFAGAEVCNQRLYKVPD